MLKLNPKQKAKANPKQKPNPELMLNPKLMLKLNPRQKAKANTELKPNPELMLKLNPKQKAKAKAKPSKAKEESKPLQEKILAFLNTQTASVCTKEIATAVGSTSPKCTSALKFLVEDGLVNKLDLGRNKPYEYIVK